MIFRFLPPAETELLEGISHYAAIRPCHTNRLASAPGVRTLVLTGVAQMTFVANHGVGVTTLVGARAAVACVEWPTAPRYSHPPRLRIWLDGDACKTRMHAIVNRRSARSYHRSNSTAN